MRSIIILDTWARPSGYEAILDGRVAYTVVSSLSMVVISMISEVLQRYGADLYSKHSCGCERTALYTTANRNLLANPPYM
jgi:hypothetical protein